jgi:dTDP-4-amino-4,6-dideoxygalactose transaminase
MKQAYEILEDKFCKFTGKKYCVALNTGTSALHLALLALGVKKGDEVIVPDFTFVACAFAVSYIGAKPVFVDCGDDMLIDPKLIEKKITKKTKVIMPVHLYGRRCNMSAIIKIANKHNLKVLEDVSEAHGIKLSNADVAIYSLQSSKIINSQEGGIVVTNNKETHDKIVHLKGLANDGKYYHDTIAFNYRMPNCVAELALKSLKSYTSNVKKRNEEAKRRGFQCDVAWVTVYFAENKEERDWMLKYIPKSRTTFKPMSTLPMYKGQKVGKKALEFSKRGLVIPISVL